jgi:hypothetical protein
MWYKVGVFLSIFMLGIAAGAAIKGREVNALQLQLNAVRAEGDAARSRAEAQIKDDRRKKEESDLEYKTTIAAIRAESDKLRHARTRTRYVPASPAGSRRPGVTCYDSAELERTLHGLIDGVSELIAEGDSGAVALNSARAWAESVKSVDIQR